MRIAILALTTLMACVPQEEAHTEPLPSGNACGADKLQHLVALPYDARDFEDEGRPLRVLPPGSMMTMDHRPDRLNVDLDAEGVITRVWCG